MYTGHYNILSMYVCMFFSIFMPTLLELEVHRFGCDFISFMMRAKRTDYLRPSELQWIGYEVNTCIDTETVHTACVYVRGKDSCTRLSQNVSRPESSAVQTCRRVRPSPISLAIAKLHAPARNRSCVRSFLFSEPVRRRRRHAHSPNAYNS